MTAQPFWPENFVPLPGSALAPLSASTNTGPADPEAVLSLAIRVRPKTPIGELRAEVDAINRLPPAQRTYLSHAQVIDRYGADPTDLDRVESWLRGLGIGITCRDDGRRALTVRGTVADLLRAFPTDLQGFDHPATGPHVLPVGAIHVPAALSEIIIAVIGFNTRPYRRNRIRADTTTPPAPDNAVQPPLVYSQQSTAAVFASWYQFPKEAINPSKSSVPLDGSGQCVGIIELGGGFTQPLLDYYFDHIVDETPPTILSIPVGGAQNNPGDLAQSVEVFLDINVVGNLLPKATIAVYFGQNGQNSQCDVGFTEAISAAIFDVQNLPKVLSISWYGFENQTAETAAIQYLAGNSASPLAVADQVYAEFNVLFDVAKALGITICVCSGDHGSWMTSENQDNFGQPISPCVTFPAVHPSVLACGGTMIVNSSEVKEGILSSDPCAEIVWNFALLNQPMSISPSGAAGTAETWASSGGFSQAFAVPTYQSNLPAAQLTPIPYPMLVPQTYQGRGFPDISMAAAWYSSSEPVATNNSGSGSGSPTQYSAAPALCCGTSASTPMMACLVTLLNQSMQVSGGDTNLFCGFLNELFYDNPSAFNIIGTGNTAIIYETPTPVTYAGFEASTTGWDPCTGLGTPIPAKILSLLSGQQPAAAGSGD